MGRILFWRATHPGGIVAAFPERTRYFDGTQHKLRASLEPVNLDIAAASAYSRPRNSLRMKLPMRFTRLRTICSGV